jgi:flavin reductase (DIM6/NTAB) family NADH-FMN oxidoreductase RutF
MIATWVTLASLRKSELRFTLALSKFNHSANAILKSGEFIIHTLFQSDCELAYKFGAFHSNDVNKFHGFDFNKHKSGIKLLSTAKAHGFCQVLKMIETEDRFVLYCNSSEFNEPKDFKQSLTQSYFFQNITPEQSKILSSKYLADSRRDEALQ